MGNNIIDGSKYGFTFETPGNWTKGNLYLYDGLMQGLEEEAFNIEVYTLVRDNNTPEQEIIIRDVPDKVEDYLKKIDREEKLQKILKDNGQRLL